jgi:hypothetical protein
VTGRFIHAATFDLDSNQINWYWHQESQNQEDNEFWIQQIRFKNWKDQVFRKVSVIFQSDACTVIPSGFYQAERSDEILSVLFRQHPPSETRGLELPAFGAKLIYRIPQAVHAVTDLFPQAVIFPSMFPFLMRPTAHLAGNVIDLDIAAGYMMIRITRGNKLIFSNFFRYHNDEDILYYLSNTCMNLDIRLSESVIQISGGVENDSTRDLLGGYCHIQEAVIPVRTDTEVSGAFINPAQIFLCA